MSAEAPGTCRTVSPLVLVLSVLLAAAATAAGVLGVLYLSNRSPGQAQGTPGSPAGGGPAAADAGPHTQQGTVKPEGLGSGDVFYPVPYASPPHLTVGPGSRYLVVRQDEYGFTWLDRARMADAGRLLAALPEVNNFLPKGEEPKFDPVQPELTWEAKGVRGTPGAQPFKLFEQTGKFQSDKGQQGQVNFPVPYASPPNVELSGSHEKTVITECTATGFKWKNGSDGKWSSEYGEVTWKAKGVRATSIPPKG